MAGPFFVYGQETDSERKQLQEQIREKKAEVDKLEKRLKTLVPPPSANNLSNLIPQLQAHFDKLPNSPTSGFAAQDENQKYLQKKIEAREFNFEIDCFVSVDVKMGNDIKALHLGFGDRAVEAPNGHRKVTEFIGKVKIAEEDWYVSVADWHAFNSESITPKTLDKISSLDASRVRVKMYAKYVTLRPKAKGSPPSERQSRNQIDISLRSQVTVEDIVLINN